MDTLTITIHPASDGGYLYDIYVGDEHIEARLEQGDSEGGGWCTTTMLNALNMATDQAADLIRKEKGTECGGCNQTIEGTVFSSTFDEDTDLCCECNGREKREGDFIFDR